MSQVNKMKIGIDGTPLAIPFHCGVRHYAENLITALSKIDRVNEYLIFSKENVSIPKRKNFRLIKIPTWIPILKKQFFLTFLAKKNNVDVFHYLEPYGSSFFQHLKIVTTVHDMNLGLIFPNKLSGIPRLSYMKFLRKKTLTSSQSIICVSTAIKKEVTQYLIKHKKNINISIIPEAHNKKFKLHKLNSKGQKKYLLCMGDFSPRKNIPRIMESYSKLQDNIRYTHRLKVIVSTQIPERELQKRARLLKIKN